MSATSPTLLALILRRYYLDLQAGANWRDRAIQFVSTIVSTKDLLR